MIPIAIATLLEGDGSTFVYGLVVLVVGHLIDNAVLQTVLISKLVDVHPLIVLIITLIGGKVLGLVGLIIAVPLYVVAEIVFSGMYEYLRALERREELIEAEIK